MKDKKAQAPEKMMFYLGFGIIYTIAFFILIIMINSFISTSLEVPEDLEITVYSQRFINSPDCFTYKDLDIRRSYPGVIDLDKFTNETLRQCYVVFGREDSESEKKEPLAEFVTAEADATYVNVPRRQAPLKNLGFRLTLIQTGIKPKHIQTQNWEGKITKTMVKDVFVMNKGILNIGKLRIEVQDVI